jgi:hypothetical protein
VQLEPAGLGDLLGCRDAVQAVRANLAVRGFEDDEYLALSTFASVASFSTSSSTEPTFCPAWRCGGLLIATVASDPALAMAGKPSSAGVLTVTVLRLAIVMPRSEASRGPSVNL